MTSSKLQYKKMTTEELVVLAQQDDFKALEELIKNEQKNVFATFSYLTNKRDEETNKIEEYIPYYHFSCFDKIVEYMKSYAKNNNLKLDRRFRFDMYKMIVFDLLTFQQSL